MNEVRVQVVGPELFERQVQVRLDVFGPVRVVPQLGHERDLFTLHTRVGDPLGNLFLVLVDQSAVDMPVAYSQGLGDRTLDLAGRSLPGAEPDLRDHNAVVAAPSAPTDMPGVTGVAHRSIHLCAKSV